MSQTTEYAPGVCNIGAAEINRRRRGGWVGLGLFVAATVALVLIGAAPAWYLVLFVPAFVAAIGFVQARRRFCVYFGFSALFNFSQLGQEARIADPESRRRDRRQAWRLTGEAALFAAGTAIASFVIALLVQ